MARVRGLLVVVVTLALAVTLGVTPASAHVRGIPGSWTPTLGTSGTDGTVEQIRQIAQCGSLMYAVGTFSGISQGGHLWYRPNVVSFSATTGQLTGWQPLPNGEVNSIAFVSDCSVAYLGGQFTTIRGAPAKNIVAVDTKVGSIVTTFAHNANGQVETLVRSGNHLLVGGYFTSINNSNRPYFASLNASYGWDDGYLNLNIAGTYEYVDAAGKHSVLNPSRVYNTELSPDGKRLLAMGVFTTVAGQPRRQIFMLDLGGTSVTLDPWYSSEFDAYCGISQPFYVQAAAWSPDGGTVYIAATGTKPATGLGSRSSDPRAGLCDAASAFPSSRGLVAHKWINYTGCDSLFSVAADASTVYVAGHERWANNPNGCGVAGPGALDAPGMVGLSPVNGAAIFNPTRARGYGADDMIVTRAGLWIASDNAFGADQCGGRPGHAGICFLPN